MPYVKKKDLKELDMIPFMGDVLREYGYDFINDPPNMWSHSETEIFDMMADLQENILTKVKEITNEH